jgi:hypothetical protein
MNAGRNVMNEQRSYVWHTADAPEPVRFAAGELARYLGRLTGDEVTVAEATAGLWLPLELRLTQGTAAPAEWAPVTAALERQVRPVAEAYATVPGVDAFLWRAAADGISIAGTNPRSTLYGVYDLLEDLGCRFFGASPDDEVVPSVGGDAIQSLMERRAERFEQATFPYRERHFLEWIDAEATRREIDYAAKRRMNGFAFHIEDFAPDQAAWRIVLDELVPEIARRGLMPGIGEHGGYPLWLPPERYATDHPDWYAQVDGRRVAGFRGPAGRYQFCTEHPAARATFLDNMEAWLRDNPRIQIMHIAPEDVGRWCECERCAPIPIADRYLRLDNAIADRLHRIRPDIWVTHLVYANHAELPERERPSPHLKISFIPFGRDFAVPITDPRANMGFSTHPWSLELIESWARLCQEVGAGFIEHTKAFRHRWITFRLLPLPHLEADLRWWQSIGAGGFNAPQEGEGWWVKHLNAYVYARLMWDLDGPAEGLLADYFQRYWGELGAAVREVYEAVAEALPNLAYSRNQPAMLPNRGTTLRLPPVEHAPAQAAYLERAIARLDAVSQRVAELQARGPVDPTIDRRLARLADAITGARAGLAVSLGMRRYLLARGTPRAAEAAAEARAAHEQFAALQTPERLQGGTLWTGAWRRDDAFAAWEREAVAP